ncbi:hypothetical protein [Lichenicoccus sp.]|uniref:hypothetical protein n=1 Tax=Lichenicoccus sp. TaxID=2781899 RepID=UPI003D0C4844
MIHAPAATLGVVLLDGSHARAHFAFSMAAGAAAMDRGVILFASGAGVRALCRDWSGLADAGHDAVLTGRGVAGLEALREAALALDVRLLACEAGLRGEAIDPGLLLDAAQVSGIASFLEAVAGGQIVAF